MTEGYQKKEEATPPTLADIGSITVLILIALALAPWVLGGFITYMVWVTDTLRGML